MSSAGTNSGWMVDAWMRQNQGILTADDVDRLAAAGARAFLVGESLMRESDPAAALRRLRRKE